MTYLLIYETGEAFTAKEISETNMQEFSQAIMGHKHAKMTAEYDDLRGGGWKVVEAKSL